jgi:hypothetical protein
MGKYNEKATFQPYTIMEDRLFNGPSKFIK